MVQLDGLSQRLPGLVVLEPGLVQLGLEQGRLGQLPGASLVALARLPELLVKHLQGGVDTPFLQHPGRSGGEGAALCLRCGLDEGDGLVQLALHLLAPAVEGVDLLRGCALLLQSAEFGVEGLRYPVLQLGLEDDRVGDRGAGLPLLPAQPAESGKGEQDQGHQRPVPVSGAALVGLLGLLDAL